MDSNVNGVSGWRGFGPTRWSPSVQRVSSASLIPGEASPTRVAAQVISGIGFLGAGLIFREGMSVRGLNTAATLWCSAAIGVLAGAGYPLYATLATGFVLFVNLLLRPIVSFINRQPLTATELEIGYVVSRHAPES